MLLIFSLTEMPGIPFVQGGYQHSHSYFLNKTHNISPNEVKIDRKNIFEKENLPKKITFASRTVPDMP